MYSSGKNLYSLLTVIWISVVLTEISAEISAETDFGRSLVKICYETAVIFMPISNKISAYNKPWLYFKSVVCLYRSCQIQNMVLCRLG